MLANPEGPGAMSRPPRIASLVPSLTELAVALGLGRQLVARTGFCVHPAEALRGVPKVGGTKDVNLARLRRLAPTHVLVNVDENRAEIAEALRAWPAGQESQRPHAPSDTPARRERPRQGPTRRCKACSGSQPELRLAP